MSHKGIWRRLFLTVETARTSFLQGMTAMFDKIQRLLFLEKKTGRIAGIESRDIKIAS